MQVVVFIVYLILQHLHRRKYCIPFVTNPNIIRIYTLCYSWVRGSKSTKFLSLYFYAHYSNDLVASALMNIVSIFVYYKIKGIDSGPK
jgi:hypothetical protein